MNDRKWKFCFFLGFFSLFLLSSNTLAQDFRIYSVYNPLHLGDENTTPVRDFFVNAGSTNGIKKGSVLKVYRRISSYDSLQKRHYQDLTVPVGTIKVVHVDTRASIARVDQFLPAEENTGLTAHHFLVGDIVRLD